MDGDYLYSPHEVNVDGLNADAEVPYGCTPEHILNAMQEFIDFLGFINEQLHTRRIARLETMLMPANFSSMVGEFMRISIPKYGTGFVKNRYHNGHPDLLPSGRFPDDAAQHSSEGIEIKASRYLSGWQGHNPEDTWLMMFVFDSNRPSDSYQGIEPKPFRFIMAAGALLTKEDWIFAGRSETSRRTITASVSGTGYRKITANWIYKDPEL